MSHLRPSMGSIRHIMCPLAYHDHSGIPWASSSLAMVFPGLVWAPLGLNKTSPSGVCLFWPDIPCQHGTSLPWDGVLQDWHVPCQGHCEPLRVYVWHSSVRIFFISSPNDLWSYRLVKATRSFFHSLRTIVT